MTFTENYQHVRNELDNLRHCLVNDAINRVVGYLPVKQ